MLILASAAPAEAKDTIRLVAGNDLSVDEVLDETVEAVRFRLGNSRSQYGAADVLEVVYGDQPPEYQSAMSNMKAGNFTRAISDFDRAIGRAGQKKWVEAYSLYGKGEAYRLNGNSAEALRAYDQFMAKFSQHLLVREVLARQGDAALAGGQLDKANQAFSKMADGALGERMQIRGQIGEGRVYLAKKEYADALAAFNSAESSAGREHEALQAEAKAGRGLAYVGMGNWQQAKSDFQDAVRSPAATEETKARAWNGTGDAESGGGNAKAALLAYLRVTVLYSGVPDQYKIALEKAAAVFENLKQPERARTLREELKRLR